MSWAEVLKINNNTKKALNEQLRDMKFQPMRVITSSTTYTPEKTGIYKVICVGQGGDGYATTSSSSYHACGGAAGGVAIKTLELSSSQTYNVTVNATASFGSIMTATAGTSSSSGGVGGTATGGDYNFSGSKGVETNSQSANKPANGGSVGVYIGDLSRVYFDHHTFSAAAEASNFTLMYGESILQYGGGAPGVIYRDSASSRLGYEATGLSAAVIIIPLEMEE